MIGWALIFGLAGTWAALRLRDRVAAQARRERLHERAMVTARDQDCSDVVRCFANNLGYIARDAISRSDLQRAIDTGISPEALTELIAERCAAVPGPTIGHHFWDTVRVPVRLPEALRTRHLYMVGRSGSGKTTLVRNLVLHDLAAGNGLAVIAPEAELLEQELMPFIPRERWDDVVYVNPADLQRPISLNPNYS